MLVEAVRGDWARCLCRDRTRGWVSTNYLCAAGGFRPRHAVRRRSAVLVRSSGSPLLLPMGALVEAGGRRGGRRGGWIAVSLPGGERGWVHPDDVARLRPRTAGARALDRVIEQVIGTPYLWGGTSTFGFDCSGLVRFIFDLFGVDLPRNACDQALRGRKVAAASPLKPLDLVFFGDPGSIDHVAIHLADRAILHASGDVRIESLDQRSGTFRADLAGRLRCVRRIVRL